MFPTTSYPSSLYNSNSLSLLNQAFSHLFLLLAILLQPDCLHPDEASSVSRLKVANLVHAGLGHVVQLLGGGEAPNDGEGALVDLAAHVTVDVLLGGDDGVLEELTLGLFPTAISISGAQVFRGLRVRGMVSYREKLSVVKDLSIVERHELVP